MTERTTKRTVRVVAYVDVVIEEDANTLSTNREDGSVRYWIDRATVVRTAGPDGDGGERSREFAKRLVSDTMRRDGWTEAK